MEKIIQPQIFLSYSWKNSDIADSIDQDFKNFGITFIRDKRDLGYRRSIREFMSWVSRTDFVVMIISNDYLLSRNCMYEVMELLEAPEFEKRILPILENNTRIFNIKDRLVYYRYWWKKYWSAAFRYIQSPNSDSKQEFEETKNIRNNISNFFTRVADLNILRYEDLQKQRYKSMISIIGFYKNESIITSSFDILKIDDKEEQEIALEKFLEIYPDDDWAMLHKGWLTESNGNYKKAEFYYANLLNKHPEYGAAYRYLGALNEKHLSRPDAAVEFYRKAADLSPQDTAPLHNLAFILRNTFKKNDQARAIYEKCIQIDPQDSWAYYNLGNLLSECFSDDNKAIECYEKSIATDPRRVGAYNNLALLFEKLLKFEKAKECYEKAIEINSESSSAAYFNLAVLLESRFSDKVSDAKKYFEKGLEISPNDAKAHHLFGNLLQKHFSDYDAAKSHYLKAIALLPTNENYYFELATLLDLKLQSYPDAVTYYEEGLKINNLNEKMHCLLALVLIRMPYSELNYSKAESHFMQAITINDKYAVGYYSFALFLFSEDKNLDLAKKYYIQAKTLDNALFNKELEEMYDLDK